MFTSAHHSLSALSRLCKGGKIHPDVNKRSGCAECRGSTAFSPCCQPRSPPHGIQVKDTAKSQTGECQSKGPGSFGGCQAVQQGKLGLSALGVGAASAPLPARAVSAPGLGRARTGTLLSFKWGRGREKERERKSGGNRGKSEQGEAAAGRERRERCLRRGCTGTQRRRRGESTGAPSQKPPQTRIYFTF